MDEGQRHLLHSYALGYPEPNVVFALCRGSRSSPAVCTHVITDCQLLLCYDIFSLYIDTYIIYIHRYIYVYIINII